MSQPRTTKVIPFDEDGQPLRCQYCGGSLKSTDRQRGHTYYDIWWTETPCGDEGFCIRCHEHYCDELDLVLSQSEWDVGECDGEVAESEEE